MRKPLVLLLIGAVLILCFQNCGKMGTQNNLFTDNSTPLVTNTQDKIDATDFREMWMPLLSVATTSSLRTNPSAAWLSVDLTTGDLNLRDQYGAYLGNKGIATGTNFSSLQNLIINSQVCLPASATTSGGYCTQAYIYPYAKFKNGTQDINLGEQLNGCYVPIDLCDNHGPVLKSWIQNLISTF